MKNLKLFKEYVSLVFLILFLAVGCTPNFKRFAAIQEVFPPTEKTELSAIPEDAYEKRVYNVPYDDMFQIVDTSASQTDLDVISSDSSKGEILAKKTSIRYGAGTPFTHVIFTKIVVREIDAKKSEVILIMKEQAECWGGFGGWCDDAHLIPTYERTSYGNPMAYELINILFSTIRNNLLAAGLL